MDVPVPIERLPHATDLPLPAYATIMSAGVDLMAAIDADQPMVIAPGERILVPTGVRLALPEGCEGQVRPRSGLAHQHGLTVLNSPGTIDADYRGEIKVLLINLGTQSYTVLRGARIAQLIVSPIRRARWVEMQVDAGTARGGGGFGSTGDGDRQVPLKAGRFNEC